MRVNSDTSEAGDLGARMYSIRHGACRQSIQQKLEAARQVVKTFRPTQKPLRGACSCSTMTCPAERWLSGLKRTPGKRECLNSTGSSNLPLSASLELQEESMKATSLAEWARP